MNKTLIQMWQGEDGIVVGPSTATQRNSIKLTKFLLKDVYVLGVGQHCYLCRLLLKKCWEIYQNKSPSVQLSRHRHQQTCSRWSKFIYIYLNHRYITHIYESMVQMWLSKHFTAFIIDSDEAYGTSFSRAQVWLNPHVSMRLETPTRKGKLAKLPPQSKLVVYCATSDIIWEIYITLRATYM